MHPSQEFCVWLVLGLASACAPSIVPSDEGGADGSAGTDSSDPARTTGPGATSMESASSSTSAGQGDTENATGAVGDTSGSEGSGETSETSAGLGTSTGEDGTSSGGEEVVCLDPLAGIAWAGNWGKRTSHACWYSDGLPEPFVVDKSNFGHDCYFFTAEVWIPGVTDVDGNEALVRTYVDFEDPTGVEDPPDSGLGFEGRYGNNYRYSVNLGGGGWWSYAELGSYEMKVRFSYLDENIGCWYTIGLGDGPDGGAPRTVALVP